MPVRAPTAELVGTIARRPFAPAPTSIVKLSSFPLQARSSRTTRRCGRRPIRAAGCRRRPVRPARERGGRRSRPSPLDATRWSVCMFATIGAVVALAPDRPVEKRVDREREGLAGLVGHLRRRLVGVDHRSVEVSEPHRHRRPGHQPRPVLDPAPRPVVVVGVEADAVVALDLRLRSPNRSRRCSACGSSTGAGTPGCFATPLRQLVVEVLSSYAGVKLPQPVLGCTPTSNPSACRRLGLRVAHRRARSRCTSLP